jgi:hypothetical protein
VAAALAIIALAACASRPAEHTAPAPANKARVETWNGGTVVETYVVNGSIGALDARKRTLTLLGADRQRRTYKTAQPLAGFDELKVGDRINATLIEELAVYVSRDKPPPGFTEGTAVALAPRAANRIVMANTVEVTANVQSVDAAQGKVTLMMDGTAKTMRVGKGVDLTKIRTGDNITAAVTEAVAILLEKP